MHSALPRDVGSYSYAETTYANPHAVTSVGGTTYAYDNNGNVTSIGSLDHTWDWRNRLASAERGGGIRTYGYDHTGQRVLKETGTPTTTDSSGVPVPASVSRKVPTSSCRFSGEPTGLAKSFCGAGGELCAVCDAV
jgi:hypothetical protein